MMYRLLHEDDAEDASRGPSPDDKAILAAFEKRLLRESDEPPEDSNNSDTAINSVKETPNENDE